jgi:hypothetical protein
MNTVENLDIKYNNRDRDSFNPATFDDVFKLWSKYEDIAMHFNELLIRLRVQALGGLTISGSLITAILKNEKSYYSLKFIFPFFLIAWGAIYCLDMLYYNRLLSGAADAIIELEAKYPSFQLSTKTANSIRSSTKGRKWFYLIVFIGLGIISVLLWFNNILDFFS